MKYRHRRIDTVSDREYILERHCRINYACDCPWKRKMSYAAYREEWFSLHNQITAFYAYFEQTAGDDRTIADIIESENGDIIGYIWAPFIEDEESGFSFADVQDVYVEEAYRHQGIAMALLAYAEQNARNHGAEVIRSGTGCENTGSIKLHEKCGYYPYRYEFEKRL